MAFSSRAQPWIIHALQYTRCNSRIFSADATASSTRASSTRAPSGKGPWLVDAITSTKDLTELKLLLERVRGRMEPMHVHAALTHMGELLKEACPTGVWIQPLKWQHTKKQADGAGRMLESEATRLRDVQLMAECNEVMQHHLVDRAATPAFISAWSSELDSSGDSSGVAAGEHRQRIAAAITHTFKTLPDAPMTDMVRFHGAVDENLQQLAASVAQHAAYFQPADAALCLVKLTRLKIEHPPAYQAVADVLVASGALGSMGGKEVVQLVWSFAKAGIVHQTLLEAVSTVLLDLTPTLSAHDLADLAWSAGKLRSHGCSLLEAMLASDHFKLRLTSIGPESLGVLAMACVRLHNRSLRIVVRQLGAAAVGMQDILALPDLINVLYACAEYRCLPQDLAGPALARLKSADLGALLTMPRGGAGHLVALLGMLVALKPADLSLADGIMPQLGTAHQCGMLSYMDAARAVTAAAQLGLADHGIIARMLCGLQSVRVSGYLNKPGSMKQEAEGRLLVISSASDAAAAARGAPAPSHAAAQQQRPWLPPPHASALLCSLADAGHRDLAFARCLMAQLLLAAPRKQLQVAATISLAAKGPGPGSWPGQLAGQNNPRELCAVAYAGAKLREVDTPVWQAVVAGIPDSLKYWPKYWSPARTSGMLWAMAEVLPGHAGVPGEHVEAAATQLLDAMTGAAMAAAGEAAEDQLRLMSADQVLDVVWGAARLGVGWHVGVEEALQLAVGHARAGAYSAHGLLQLLWSIVVCGHSTRPLLRQLAPALAARMQLAPASEATVEQQTPAGVNVNLGAMESGSREGLQQTSTDQREEAALMSAEDCAHVAYCYLHAAGFSVTSLTSALVARCVQLARGGDCKPEAAAKLLSVFASPAAAAAKVDAAVVQPLVDALLPPGASPPMPAQHPATHSSQAVASGGKGKRRRGSAAAAGAVLLADHAGVQSRAHGRRDSMWMESELQDSEEAGGQKQAVLHG